MAAQGDGLSHGPPLLAVIELYPFRRPDLHPAAIRFHYWIDVLIELPLVLALIATGTALAFSVPVLSGLHLIKIGFGAVAVNLFCIAVVVRRKRRLERDDATSPFGVLPGSS